MRWQFIDNSTLEDIESGFKIILLDGTWNRPGRLKSETPEHVSYSEQLKLTKSGLRYIKSMASRESSHKNVV